MEFNFFLLLTQLLLFFTYYVIYLITMIRNPKLWHGILDDDHWYLLIFDAFYFTISTHTSLGYGDIIPKSRIIRMITSLHMISVFTFFFFIY
jgi:hypothetical protein